MQPPQPQPEPASRRSSSTCSTAPRRRSSGIGCMAGLLRLISPYHRSHHRKRLTAKNNAAARDSPQALPITPSSSPPRKKAAAQAQQTSAASPAPASPVKPTMQQLMTTAVTVRRRRSCDAPRSPTIAPEHRRSSCDSPRPPPPAIIARLMGLEESAPPSPAAATAAPRPVVLPTRPPPPPPAPAAPETAAEKRRKLLGALEKCDEDLKTLRRIIAAVRAAEMRAASASDVCPVAATTTTTPAGKGAKSTFCRNDEQSPSPSPPTPTPQQQHKVVRAGEQQYPSPDSVLDAISSPRFPCRKRPSPCTDLDVGGKGGCGNGALAPTVGSKIVKPSRTLVFSGGYCKTKSDGDELPLHAVHSPVPLVVGMPPRSAGAESWRHHRRRWEQEAAAAGRVISRATAESVGEAIMWVRQQQGQLGGAGDDERGRVAAALERAIVHDLVADLVAELLQAQSGGHGAGSGCRKRLCF